jgi:hypothetical protein
MQRGDFEELSRRVWKFLHDAPFKPREETITEGLLTHLHRDFHGSSVVSKATSGEEASGGHDWLWAIRSADRKRVLHLRVQAKMLFGTQSHRIGPHNRGQGRYRSLGRDAATNQEARAQVEKLMESSRRTRQIPVYAFFNGEARPFGGAGTSGISLGCGRAPFERGAPAVPGPPSNPSAKSALGVTLADARWIRFHLNAALSNPARSPRWPITPAAVNPGAIPWECLTCDLSNCSTTRPATWSLGQARIALHSTTGGAPGALGVSGQPQSWARHLLRGDAEAAWRAAHRIQTALDASEQDLDEETLFGDLETDASDYDDPLPDDLLPNQVEPDATDEAGPPTFLVVTSLAPQD